MKTTTFAFTPTSAENNRNQGAEGVQKVISPEKCIV